jgi:hypothetical protein
MYIEDVCSELWSWFMSSDTNGTLNHLEHCHPCFLMVPSSNPLFSDGTQFKSWSEHQAVWMRDFMSFSVSSDQSPNIVHWLGHDCLPKNPLQLFTSHHAVGCVTENCKINPKSELPLDLSEDEEGLNDH